MEKLFLALPMTLMMAPEVSSALGLLLAFLGLWWVSTTHFPPRLSIFALTWGFWLGLILTDAVLEVLVGKASFLHSVAWRFKTWSVWTLIVVAGVSLCVALVRLRRGARGGHQIQHLWVRAGHFLCAVSLLPDLTELTPIIEASASAHELSHNHQLFVLGPFVLILEYLLWSNDRRPLTAIKKLLEESGRRPRATGAAGESPARAIVARRETPGSHARYEETDGIPDIDLLIKLCCCVRMLALLHDEEGRIVEANERFVALVGLRREALLGKALPSLAWDDATRDAMSDEFAAALADRSPGFHRTFDLRSSAGERVRLIASTCVFRARDSGMLIALSIGCEMEPAMFTLSDQAQAEKLMALGQLSAGIAHDFNNLLGIIGGNLGYVRRHTAAGKDPELAEALSDCEAAVSEATHLIGILLGKPGGTDGGEANLADLNTVVNMALARFRRSLDANLVEVRVEPGTGVDNMMVTMPPTVLGSVVLNVLSNAEAALAGRGIISVSLRQRDKYAFVRISDNGCGIDEADLARIFEPYFSTRKKSGGRGLGLWMVRTNVERSGGSVRVSSIVGRGTTISIRIPIANDVLPEQETSTLENSTRTRNRCVLAVDDDPTMRRTVVRMLRESRMEVVACANPAEARAVIRERKQEVDVVITDVVMAGEEDGEALVRWLAQECPEIPVVVMTGYMPSDTAPFGDIGHSYPNASALLRKPFTADMLEHAVVVALEGRDGSQSL